MIVRGTALPGALAVLAVIAGCGGGDDEATSTSTSSTTTTSTTEAQSPETNLNKAATKISVAGDWLAAGEGGVWISGSTEIERLDPKSGKPSGVVKVPEGPCEASDVGFGAVWTATCFEPGLARIDPETLEVTDHVALKIPKSLGGEGSIGAGEGGVWLVVDGSGCDACRVVRVDPESLEVETETPVEPGAAGVRAGGGAVWVTNPDEDLVQSLDPATGKVVSKTKVPGAPRFLAVGEGAVWTLNQVDGSIVRIDPESAEIAATIDTGMTGGGGDMTAGGGFVWARSNYTIAARIDPETDQVVERYAPSSGSGAIAVGYGAVWISAHDVETVWRLPLGGG